MDIILLLSIRDLLALVCGGFREQFRMDKFPHAQDVLSVPQGLNLAALDAVILWSLTPPRLICFSVHPTYKETGQPHKVGLVAGRKE